MLVITISDPDTVGHMTKRAPLLHAGVPSATGALMAAGLLLAAGTQAHTSPARVQERAASAVHGIAVFGRDDRGVLPPARRGFSEQIGLLYEPRSRSVCTAFCVAPDIVATAAHCLFRTNGERPLKLDGMWFRLGLRNVRSHTRLSGAGAGGAGQHVMSGSMRLSVRPPIDASRDWALVRLARPVCRAGALRFSRRPAAEAIKLAAQRKLYQIGFHRDFRTWELALSRCDADPKLISRIDGKALARDFTEIDQLLLHTCDTGGASSGSPLFIDGPSGPEVVGMNVGTYVRSKVMMQNRKVLRRYKPDNIANTGVSAVPLGARLAIFSKAAIVRDRERMRELQQLLARSGHSPGPADGVYGPGLKAAIEAYERAQGFAVTGLATEALVKRLAPPPSARAGAALE